MKDGEKVIESFKAPVVPEGVYAGQVKQSFGLETAIEKSPVTGAVFLSRTGLEGDQCADPKYHGGAERALHHYPLEHYRYWRSCYGEQFGIGAPGMGENISTLGMTEDTVCLGDRFQWGQAVIEVSQPRSPCFKLNRRWAVENFSVEMQANSRCGWLYRVIQEGNVSADDPLVLVDRVAEPLTVKQVCDLFFGTPLDREALLRLQQQARLSQSWMSKVESRLETGKLENWNFRLLGHA